MELAQLSRRNVKARSLQLVLLGYVLQQRHSHGACKRQETVLAKQGRKNLAFLCISHISISSLQVTPTSTPIVSWNFWMLPWVHVLSC